MQVKPPEYYVAQRRRRQAVGLCRAALGRRKLKLWTFKKAHCTGKVRHNSQAEAEQAIREIEAEHNDYNLVAYKCFLCTGVA